MRTQRLSPSTRTWPTRTPPSGRLHERTSQDALAAQSYERAVRLREDDSATHGALGGVYQRLGRHDDAARELARASELKGTDPDTLFELGVAHAKGKRWAQARDALEKAVKLRGEHAPSWKLLAQAYRETGPVASAVAAYERALALAPDWTEGQRDVAPLYAEVGRDDGCGEGIRCADRRGSREPRRGPRAGLPAPRGVRQGGGVLRTRGRASVGAPPRRGRASGSRSRSSRDTTRRAAR